MSGQRATLDRRFAGPAFVGRLSERSPFMAFWVAVNGALAEIGHHEANRREAWAAFVAGESGSEAADRIALDRRA
jgi:hypothetical protein